MGTVEYLKHVFKDPSVYSVLKQMLYRARRVALILGGVLVATLILVVSLHLCRMLNSRWLLREGLT